MVKSDIPIDKAKNGAARKKSILSSRLRCHQASNSSARGSTTVEGLLVNAAAKLTRESANQPGFSLRSNRKKHSSEAKKNSPDCVYCSSVTQATDSTLTG